MRLTIESIGSAKFSENGLKNMKPRRLALSSTRRPRPNIGKIIGKNYVSRLLNIIEQTEISVTVRPGTGIGRTPKGVWLN